MTWRKVLVQEISSYLHFLILASGVTNRNSVLSPLCGEKCNFLKSLSTISTRGKQSEGVTSRDALECCSEFRERRDDPHEDSPVVNVGSTAFTVVDVQGQKAEEEEETGHSKTDSVYCRIPHQLLTGVTSFNAFTDIFKIRDLKKKRKRLC